MNNVILNQLKFVEPTSQRTRMVGPSKYIINVRALVRGKIRKQNSFEIDLRIFFKNMNITSERASVAFVDNKMVLVLDSDDLPSFHIIKSNSVISNIQLVEQLFEFFGHPVNYDEDANNRMVLVFTTSLGENVFLFEKMGVINKTILNGSHK